MSFFPLVFDELRPVRRDWVVSALDPYLDEIFGQIKNRQANQALQQLGSPDETAIVANKDNFQASIDVQQFKPEEITVKLSEDNTVTVEGKHEERQDQHGYISRHFVRKYILPENYDPEKLQSKLSSDGVLNIVAPKKPEGKQVEYKEIPIILTGPVKNVGKKVQNKSKPKRLNKKGPHSIC